MNPHEFDLLSNEIAAAKYFKQSFNDSVVEWAVFLMEQGYTDPCLCELAGQTAPFHWSEIDPLIAECLVAAKIDLPLTDQAAAKNLFYRRVEALVASQGTDLTILRGLQEFVFADEKWRASLQDFYLLGYAVEEELAFGEQHYWDGLTTENWSQVVLEASMEWLAQ